MNLVRNPGAPVGSAESNYQEILNDVRIAMANNRKFIRLIHRTDGLVPERIYPVDGVRVTHTIDMRTKSPKNEVRDIEDAGCIFIPDPLTGVREAILLDTKRNREFLASHLLEDRWIIEDPIVLQQVREIAQKMTPVVDTTKMATVASQQHVVQNEAADLAMLSPQQKKELIERRKKEIEALEKGLELDAVAEEAAQAPAAPTANPGTKTFDEQVRKSMPGHIKARATRIVYTKHATRIAELKALYGMEGMKVSMEYQKEIQPEIDAIMAREIGVTPAL